MAMNPKKITKAEMHTMSCIDDNCDKASCILYREQEAEIAKLEREIKYLRHYGNKDCTAMAEEAMKNREMEK